MVGADNRRPARLVVAHQHRRLHRSYARAVPQPDPNGVVACRLLADPDDLAAAAEVVNTVWDDPTLASPSLLRAYTHFGNPTIGAFVDGVLCGVSIGFLAPSGGVHLHSHITGVLPAWQHLGVGFALKLAQRDWCVANGIDEITWTFDPMLARNAHFNLRKLGARAWTILPNFYGAMDDAINRGDETDRLEVHWMVAAAASGTSVAAAERTVALPEDYVALRAADAEAAQAERKRVRVELEDAFAAGLEAIDFIDGAYVLARRPATPSSP
jgi:predicted GNAT superfamily acetyltransferase